MTSKSVSISMHVRQRTREWFRKAEHELAFLRSHLWIKLTRQRIPLEKWLTWLLSIR